MSRHLLPGVTTIRPTDEPNIFSIQLDGETGTISIREPLSELSTVYTIEPLEESLSINVGGIPSLIIDEEGISTTVLSSINMGSEIFIPTDIGSHTVTGNIEATSASFRLSPINSSSTYQVVMSLAIAGLDTPGGATAMYAITISSGTLFSNTIYLRANDRSISYNPMYNAGTQTLTINVTAIPTTPVPTGMHVFTAKFDIVST